MSRPRPPWHPVPLAELAMLIGLVSVVGGMFAQDPRWVVGGLVILVAGVAELALREHLAGCRSHVPLLAFVGTGTLHLLVVVVAPFRVIGPGALAFDLAVFGGLAWLLRRVRGALVPVGQDDAEMLEGDAADKRPGVLSIGDQR
jgi:hypothetical protein